ncbi:MAG: biotin transporter BioY, partial [Gemmatimonadota bacterium]|nr:biotin transporter BioY [Gemmatimonadota bacterium]
MSTRLSVAARSRAAVMSSPRVRGVAAAVAAAAVTALGARAAVPLPGIPVPFTLQPVALLLAGVLLGPRLGAASQALYLAAGAAGLPVFAAGGGAAYLLGPTGGYLLAFPLAAAIAGVVARWRPGATGAGLGAAAGLVAIHVGGLSWLRIAVGAEAARAVGVLPFLAGDVLKVALVAVLAVGARRLLRP